MKWSVLICTLIIELTLAQLAFGAIDKEHTIDSLKQVIDSDTHDTIRLSAILAWDNMIYYSDPDLDRELNFKITTICAANLDKQLHPKEELFFKKFQAKSYNNLALIFKSSGNVDQAEAYHTKSLEIYIELQDIKGIALLKMNLGNIYHLKGDLVNALKYYYESLKIYEEVGEKKGEAGVFNNIGAVYHYQRDYKEAVQYYTKSLDLYLELGLTAKAARNYSNIGLVYYEQGDSLEKAGKIEEANSKYDLSLEYHNKALEIFKEYDTKQWMGVIYNNIGTSYYAKKKYDIALDFFTLSYEIKKELNNVAEMSNSLSNIAEIYHIKGNYSLAREKGEEAYLLAKESKSILRVNAAAHVLYKIYKKLNQNTLALKYHEEFMSTKDSLENEKNDKLTIQQQFKYEYDKKAAADSIVQAEELKVKNAEIAAQNAESEKDKLVIKRQREQKYYLFGGIGLVTLFGLFMANRFWFIRRQKKIIETQKKEVETQKDKIELQHEQLEETHREISDSIRYAKRLQTAILPELEDLNRELKKGFVLFKPKDVVSGDFYWMQKSSDSVLFAAADCTGHGVPGAMVSVVCSNALNRSVKEFNLLEPADILNKTKELVIETFEGSNSDIKDGMDIALCKLTESANGAELVFAGANNPIWILRSSSNEIEEIKGSKQPIGKYETDDPFVQHSITLSKDDNLYIFSDGYADQFGGERGKKFKYRTLKNALIEMRGLSMDDQKLKLEQIFNDWKRDFEQVDDVTLIGVKI